MLGGHSCACRFVVCIACVFVGQVASDSICDKVEGNFVLKAICDAVAGNNKATPQKKSKGFEVIGAGAGRTGTASLQAAFDILGYNAYHMKEVMINKHGDAWYDLHDGKKGIKEIADLLSAGGFDASADDPVQAWTFELLELNPNAKVVLTTRDDPEKWLNSLEQLSGIDSTLVRPPWSWLPLFRAFHRFCRKFHQDRGYDLGRVDRAVALKWYHDWNAKVRAKVPKHQLLDFDVKQGWGPLCEFLGKPIPNVPFPHVNDAAGFAIALKVLNGIASGLFVFPVIVLLLCYVCCKGSGKDKTA